MRLTSVRPGDLVVIEDRRGDHYFALVGERLRGKLRVLPLDAKPATEVSGRSVVGHYSRRGADVRIVRNLVSRIRHRCGVTVGTIAADLASFEVKA